MITIKRLLLFSCLALLGGCATSPCPPAGTASYSCDSCWYKFKVTALFPDTDEVEGIYTQDVQSRKGHPTKTFRFHVENVAMKKKTGQLIQDETYVFHNVDHTVYLQVMPKGYDVEKD